MYHGTCEQCGKPFEAERRRKCCSRSCAATLGYASKDGAAWEPDADGWLEWNAGRYPIQELANRFRTAAANHGWAPRTTLAIRIRLRRLGLSQCCTENNWTIRELARQLEIPVERVRGWCRSGLLKSRKVARNQSAINREWLKRFCLENPSRVASIDRDNLAYLVGEEIADQVAEAEPNRVGYCRPVICLDNGRVYPSLRRAAIENFLHPAGIRRAMDRRNGKAGGKRWAYVDEVGKSGVA